MGEGKLDDCEMELVMMSRGEAALSRRGFRSLISRWWETTFTAKVVSRPVVVVFQYSKGDQLTGQINPLDYIATFCRW